MIAKTISICWSNSYSWFRWSFWRISEKSWCSSRDNKRNRIKSRSWRGFRTYESIEKAYNIGVTYVIVGTAAFDLEFLRKVTQDFTNITVSLDVEKGKLKPKVGSKTLIRI